MNLEQRFKKETGFDAYKDNDLEPKIPLGYYVEWLEEQLILSDVSIELPSDDDLNNYVIDLKTPLDEFYYYHRPQHDADEQKTFRKSLLKVLNYIKGN